MDTGGLERKESVDLRCSLASETGTSISTSMLSISVLDSMGHKTELQKYHAPLLSPDWRLFSRDRRTVGAHIEGFGSLYLVIKL